MTGALGVACTRQSSVADRTECALRGLIAIASQESIERVPFRINETRTTVDIHRIPPSRWATIEPVNVGYEIHVNVSKSKPIRREVVALMQLARSVRGLREWAGLRQGFTYELAFSDERTVLKCAADGNEVGRVSLVTLNNKTGEIVFIPGR